MRWIVYKIFILLGNLFMVVIATVILTACGVMPATEPTRTATAEQVPEISLAILPYQVPPHIYDIWTPVADHLYKETDQPVDIITTDVYSNYLPEVLDKKPELAYFNALQYLTAHKEGGYQAFIAPNQPMRGRIIVRADSPIQTIEELRGKSITFLPANAMPGHLQPKAMLKEHGLVAGQDYTVVEVANHNLSLNSIVAGQVDAGAAGVAAFETLPAETKSQLRILAETPPQPPVVIAVRDDIEPALRNQLAAALLSLNDTAEGQAILAGLGWPELMLVTDADYDTTRHFAHTLGLEY